MPAYDARGRAQAIRQLAPIARGGKGQEVTLSRAVGAYNPETGAHTATTTTTVGSGVALGHKARDIDGDLIREGDKRLLLSPVDEDGVDIAVPVVDETSVTLADGSVWAVTAVSTLKPANTAIMHTLNLRGAG
jgi:hypothetical protein